MESKDIDGRNDEFMNFLKFRMLLVAVFFLLAFVVLIARSFQLQVIERKTILETLDGEISRRENKFLFQKKAIDAAGERISELNKEKLNKANSKTESYLIKIQKQKSLEVIRINQLRKETEDLKNEIEMLKLRKRKIKELDEDTIKIIRSLTENENHFFLSGLINFLMGVIASLAASYLFFHRKKLFYEAIELLQFVKSTAPAAIKNFIFSQQPSENTDQNRKRIVRENA